MEREKTTLKLSKCEVDIVSYFTWLEAKQIEEVLLSGAKVDSSGLSGFDSSSMLKSKVKAFEFGVLEIRTGDKVEQFSEEWLATLSQTDGNLLEKTLDEAGKKKD